MAKIQADLTECSCIAKEGGATEFNCISMCHLCLLCIQYMVGLPSSTINLHKIHKPGNPGRPSVIMHCANRKDLEVR